MEPAPLADVENPMHETRLPSAPAGEQPHEAARLWAKRLFWPPWKLGVYLLIVMAILVFRSSSTTRFMIVLAFGSVLLIG